MQKRALITGITGQDGSYLAEFLLNKDYEVWGTLRRSSAFNTERIDHIFDKLHLEYADLTDSGSLNWLIAKCSPDEIYNLGAQSHVRTSFDVPEYTANATGLGALRLFDAVRGLGCPEPKIYQASSSEMFGNASPHAQDENTPFKPRSPYGAAKVFAHNISHTYRDSYQMFIANGILFNHESPRRGRTFVTRKIAHGVAQIIKDGYGVIHLGNLDAHRDWGYAPEYVEAMWKMLQQDKPDDFVIATGETHSVREFLSEAFRYVGIKHWGEHVIHSVAHTRPSEVDFLLGNPDKAKNILGWEAKVRFEKLVRIMVEAELAKNN
jgi:GDPmannose 4,6-dehydratase